MRSHTAVLGTVLLLAGAAVFCARAEAADLQVTISVTINQSVSIAWGAGTSTDDNQPPVSHPAGDTAPFYWLAKNGSAVPTDLALNQTVISDDANNGKTIKVSCLSQTGSSAAISASVGTPAGWSVAGATGSNAFAIQATLGTTAAPLASTGGVSLGTLVAGTANDKALVLALTTPTGVTIHGGSQQVISVTLTGTVAP